MHSCSNCVSFVFGKDDSGGKPHKKNRTPSRGKAPHGHGIDDGWSQGDHLCADRARVPWKRHRRDRRCESDTAVTGAVKATMP